MLEINSIAIEFVLTFIVNQFFSLIYTHSKFLFSNFTGWEKKTGAARARKMRKLVGFNINDGYVYLWTISTRALLEISTWNVNVYEFSKLSLFQPHHSHMHKHTQTPTNIRKYRHTYTLRHLCYPRTDIFITCILIVAGYIRTTIR